MKDGDPKFTPVQEENIRRHAYINYMADGIEQEVVNEMNISHQVKSEDSRNPLIVKPSRPVIEIFRRVADSIYQDEIATDANTRVRSKVDEINKIREEDKERRHKAENRGLDNLFGDDKPFT